MRRTRLLNSYALLVTIGMLGACRGDIARHPPVHLVQNMDQQRRYDPQEPNPMFGDRRGMRPEIEGTVARGELRDDDHLHRGRSGARWAIRPPMPMDVSLLSRGQSRFNVFCAPCHDRSGTGQGVVAQRGAKHGMVAIPNFHDSRVRSMPLGQVYDVITSGARTMPSYRVQIPLRDRWAVAAYVRVLQVSRGASIDRVPTEVIEQMGWATSEDPAAGADAAEPKSADTPTAPDTPAASDTPNTPDADDKPGTPGETSGKESDAK